jgi:hypothetical protein
MARGQRAAVRGEAGRKEEKQKKTEEKVSGPFNLDG